MKNRTVFIPTENAEEYLKKMGFYKNVNEKTIKKVFLEVLKDYFLGEVPARFLSAVAGIIYSDYILHGNITIYDAKLSSAVEDADKLEYFRKEENASKIISIEDELKRYFKEVLQSRREKKKTPK